MVFVVVLALVGAQPAAAAQSPGFLSRLASAWSAVTGTGGQALANLWDGLGARQRFAARNGQEKKGLGIDPNGVMVATEEDETPALVTGPGGE
ncbi:MAG TPA: hypothetical protein VG477_05675 [Thermoanaerobaculia bacterium]|nr:hypothetical protein [Thermoanaerobaculia bacterium]